MIRESLKSTKAAAINTRLNRSSHQRFALGQSRQYSAAQTASSPSHQKFAGKIAGALQAEAKRIIVVLGHWIVVVGEQQKGNEAEESLAAPRPQKSPLLSQEVSPR